MELEILYQDEYLVVINKPNGLAVHRSKLVGNTNVFALQLLRDQIDQKVFPIHRLDRKTSGVLLFALSPKVLSLMQKLFREKEILKTYVAIVRGHTKQHEIIDYPLTNGNNKTQEAITEYSLLAATEVNRPLGKHATSRYSLLEIKPQTGRMHQIRKHMNHIRHPIIGDRPQGCSKQNRMFLEKWNMNTMMLHAQKIDFIHPITKDQISILAEFPNEFKRVLNLLSLDFSSSRK
ncbi:MAG: pseudouridylate synthase [Flavobacteriales bacterium]|nr:pseudouridylate synthase [Flavobacteriales bacterium]